jgi:RNA pseudouridylate synthase
VLRWPKELHRLDAATGGLLVCAKTQRAQQALSRAFARREVKKRYRALVAGELRGCGRVTILLEGKACWTEYRCVAVHASAICGAATEVDLWPHTGRRHQLRLHMALLGHTILGDALYWRRLPPRKFHQKVEISGDEGAGRAVDGHVKIGEEELIDAPGTGLAVPAAAAAWGTGERSRDGARVASAEPDASSAGRGDKRTVLDGADDSAGNRLADVTAAGDLGTDTARQRHREGASTEPAARSICTASAAPAHGVDACGADAQGVDSSDVQPLLVEGGHGQSDGASAVQAMECGHASDDGAELDDADAAPGAEAQRWRQAHARAMCLWALQCRFAHPQDGHEVDVCIKRPELFAETIAAHAAC